MKIRTSHVLLAIGVVAGVFCAVILTVPSRQSASGIVLERKIAALLGEASTRNLLAPLALQAAKSGAEPHRRALREAFLSKSTFEEYYRKRLVETGTAPDDMEARVRLVVDDSIAAREMARYLGPLTADGIMRACLGSGEEVGGHLWMVFRFAALQEKRIDPLRR